MLNECVCACVHHLAILISLLDGVCQMDLSVSDFDVNEPQTASFCTNRGSMLLWNKNSTRE